jgi:hypothetical protein
MSGSNAVAVVVGADEIGRVVDETESLAVVGADAVGIDVVIPVAVVGVVVVTPITGAVIGVAVPVVVPGCTRTPLTAGVAVAVLFVATTVAGTFATATLYGCGYERHAGSDHSFDVMSLRVTDGKLACFGTRVTVSAPPASEIAPACTPATQIAESSGYTSLPQITPRSESPAGGHTSVMGVE